MDEEGSNGSQDDTVKLKEEAKSPHLWDDWNILSQNGSILKLLDLFPPKIDP